MDHPIIFFDEEEFGLVHFPTQQISSLAFTIVILHLSGPAQGTPFNSEQVLEIWTIIDSFD